MPHTAVPQPTAPGPTPHGPHGAGAAAHPRGADRAGEHGRRDRSRCAHPADIRGDPAGHGRRTGAGPHLLDHPLVEPMLDEVSGRVEDRVVDEARALVVAAVGMGSRLRGWHSLRSPHAATPGSALDHAPLPGLESRPDGAEGGHRGLPRSGSVLPLEDPEKVTRMSGQVCGPAAAHGVRRPLNDGASRRITRRARNPRSRWRRSPRSGPGSCSAPRRRA